MYSKITDESGSPIEMANPLPITEANTPLRKSIEKKYFLGQSESLSLSGATNGYAEIYNPPDSGVNLHLAVWTVSNTTTDAAVNFVARAYFGAEIADAKTESALFTCVNLIAPVPVPKAKIRYVSGTASTPSAGLEGYTRRIPGVSTIVSDESGKFIIPPGKAFALAVTAATAAATCRVAFGWWEEEA